jgi:hypothetical protein
MESENLFKKYGWMVGLGTLAVLGLGVGVGMFIKQPPAKEVIVPQNAPAIIPQNSPTRSDTAGNTAIPGVGDKNVADNVAVPDALTNLTPGGAIQKRSFDDLLIDNDKFDPDTIVVHQGDTLRLNFTAVDKDYDFTQPDYFLSYPIPKGQKKMIPFQATIAGKFTFYCEKCGGPARGPVGYLEVLAK